MTLNILLFLQWSSEGLYHCFTEATSLLTCIALQALLAASIVATDPICLYKTATYPSMDSHFSQTENQELIEVLPFELL